MLRLFLLLALWPLSLAAQGTRTVTPTAGNATTSQSATANASISPPTLFTPPPPDSDDDGDGLSLALELIRGSDPNIPHTDGDAAPDALDGWPREAAITQPPLPATGYVHVPLSALHPAFPATGNPPFVVRRLGNDWRVLTETLFNSGPSTRELHLRDLRTGTSELVLTAPASYAAHCFGLSGVDADAFFAKYAMWMNSSPSGEHGPFGFPGISSYASNPLHRPDRAVARNGGIASCFFNGSSIQTRYRAPDGTTRVLPLNPLPIPPGGDVSFQTATPLLVNDAGDVVTLEIGYFGRKNSSSATYYATRSKHLAIYLNRANGASQRLGPGMDRLIRPTESTSGSIFLPYALTNEGKMMGQLFSADGSPALFGWWNDQFRPAPPGTGSALYVSAIDAAPGRPALGLTTKTPSGSRWAMEAPDGTVTWPDAEVWLPQQQVQGRPHQIRGLNSELEYVADAAITNQGSSVWNGVTRNGVFQQIPAPAGYSPIYADINDHGALLSGRYLTIQASFTVDANRDGIIDDQDVNAVNAAKPYRFWSNDDNDSGAIGGNDVPGQPTGNFNMADNPDYETTSNATIGQVDGVSDLVDFFPVFLEIKQLLGVLPHTTAGITYKLKHADSALNFVYTNKTRAEAFDHLRKVMSTGYGSGFTQPAGSARTDKITAAGVALSTAFLDGIKNNDWGVILVEGCATTTAPLRLVVEKDGVEIAEVAVNIKISPVEQMFRHVNLTAVPKNYDGSAPNIPQPAEATRTGQPPAYPDSLTNGKYFVFVHGYNVHAQKARGWQAEVFKRMYALGSKARFVGVTWHGATGLDYHRAVYHAFQTGDALAGALAFTGNADVTIAAHSLGNMVVGHAIQSAGFTPSRYYMVNAATPLEAYAIGDVGANEPANMTELAWRSYVPRLYMANWHELFAATPSDNRGRFTWKLFFQNVALTNGLAHNFYSEEEDVVTDADGNTSASVMATLLNQGFDVSTGAWKAQELVKGVDWSTSLVSIFMIRGQAGWGFSPYWDDVYGDPGTGMIQTRKSPADAAQLSDAQLREHPFFADFLEPALVSTNASTASAEAGEANVRYDLFARAIPAMSNAAAANSMTSLGNRNYPMHTAGKAQNNGAFPTPDNMWRHSDFKDVALPYVYPMYEEMISRGALK